jgi:Zn-dependent peptidase ImmA (M78 family)
MKTAILLAMMLCVGTASAQDQLRDQIAGIKRDFSRPISEWTDEFVQETFQKFLNLSVQQILWDDEFHARVKDRLPARQPKVRVTIESELRTPYINGNEIVVPVSYVRYLYAIAMLVGHDVYVQDNYVRMGRPLLTTPFRESAILPILAPPIHNAVDVEAFNSMQAYLVCPPENQQCQVIQGQAVLAAILFTVLHELSHQFLHHVVSEEGVNVDQEIAADQNAYLVLLQMAGEFKDYKDEVQKEIKLTIELTPIVWLQVESSREGIANVVAAARERALLNHFSGDEREDIDDFIRPERTKENVQQLEIAARETPQRILIDGVEFRPDDVIGKKLTVASMKHTIVALRPGEIALAVSDTSDGDSKIQLMFQPFPTFDLVAVQNAQHQRKWSEVLFRTSNEKLQPRDPTVALAHWEALHRFGMDSCIIVADWNSIPSSKWERVLQWKRDGEPLASWY